MDQTLGTERWRTQSPYPHWAHVLLEKIKSKQMIAWPWVATCFVRSTCKVQRWPRDCSSSVSCSVMSDSLQPHGLQPAKLLCPWNFPGKNTGMGRHSQRQRRPPKNESTLRAWSVCLLFLSPNQICPSSDQKHRAGSEMCEDPVLLKVPKWQALTGFSSLVPASPWSILPSSLPLSSPLSAYLFL